MLHLSALLLLAFVPCPDGSAGASAGLRAELPPVPPYPASGEIAPELQERYVFLAGNEGALIVTFPSNLGFDVGASGEERTTEKVALAINTCPSIDVRVRELDGKPGWYEYQFRLANGAPAVQSIGRWALPVPSGVEIASGSRPEGWGVTTREEGGAALLEAKSASWGDEYRERMRGAMIRRSVKWYAMFTDYLITPGSAPESFTVETDARPGIGRIFVQASPYMIGTKARMPEAVGHQLWAFNFIENNSLSIPVIVPKFPIQGVDEHSIAVDFHDRIEELIADGSLSNGSRFVRGALAHLSSIVARDDEAIYPADWLEHPENDFERQIADALRLSLRSTD